MPNLRVAEDIVPLSDFKARASELLKRLAETGAPIVITQNGRAAGVLLSPAEFDALTERDPFRQRSRDGSRRRQIGQRCPARKYGRGGPEPGRRPGMRSTIVFVAP